MPPRLKLRPLWIPGCGDELDETPDNTILYHSGRAYCGKCGKNCPEDLMVYGSLSWGKPIDHYCKTCIGPGFVSYEEYIEASTTSGL